MSKYYLKSGGIGEYDEQPKYLEVTKRLYRPYDKLFCNTVDKQASEITSILAVPKLTMS